MRLLSFDQKKLLNLQVRNLQLVTESNQVNTQKTYFTNSLGGNYCSGKVSVGKTYSKEIVLYCKGRTCIGAVCVYYDMLFPNCISKKYRIEIQG